MSRLSRSAGFSLTELMIVVAIILILLTVAIPNYMRFAMKTKEAEAIKNLHGIRTYEESYRAENNIYYTCRVSPGALNGTKPVPWVDMGTPGTDAFADIGFEPIGSVRYRYRAAAQNGGADFIAIARGDMDEDGKLEEFRLDTADPIYPELLRTEEE